MFALSPFYASFSNLKGQKQGNNNLAAKYYNVEKLLPLGIDSPLEGIKMTNIKWIFFDIGSTLIDESECYKLRYREAVAGTTINAEEFERKVIEFSKQNMKGDHEAVKYYGIKLPSWHKEAEKLYADAEYVLNKHTVYKT